MMMSKKNKLLNTLGQLTNERQQEIMDTLQAEINARESIKENLWSLLQLTMSKSGIVIELDSVALIAAMESAGFTTSPKKKADPSILYAGTKA